MAVILGTTPPKPTPAHNAIGRQPLPFDSRAKAPPLALNVAPLPTDVTALRTIRENAEARLLAAEVHAAGIAAGCTVDDLQRLGVARLRELKANAARRDECPGYNLNVINGRASGSLVDAFRMQHGAHNAMDEGELVRLASEVQTLVRGASMDSMKAFGGELLLKLKAHLQDANA